MIHAKGVVHLRPAGQENPKLATGEIEIHVDELVILNESAGAELPRQADIFVPGGAQFKHLTQMSKAGIPTITLAFGPNTAGGAYVPGMSDYSVFVKERGTAPAFAKAAT